MSRSARIVTLTVTAVLTVAVFAGLWMVRPGEDSQVLTAARERQAEGLVSVSEPLETDTATLSEQQQFANEVQAILLNDSTFRREIEALLIADEDFIAQIKDAVMPEVRTEVDTLVASYASEYESEIRTMVEEESLKYSDTTRLVDELIGPITNRIYADFSADSEYVNEVARIVSERISTTTSVSEAELERYAIDIYNRYYDEIIADIVQRVLAALDEYTAQTTAEAAEPAVPSAPVFEPSTRVVTAPDFSSVNVVPESDYEAVRAAERERAIRSVLNSLTD